MALINPEDIKRALKYGRRLVRKGQAFHDEEMQREAKNIVRVIEQLSGFNA